MDLSI